MPHIRHELIISAPPESIYAAITTTRGLSGWWTPYATAKAELNSIASFPFGEGYTKEMRITRLVALSEVHWTCIRGATEWVGTNLRFKLESGSAETMASTHPEIGGQIEQQKASKDYSILIFQHDDWKDYTPMFSECNYTWALFLRSLKLYCETGSGRPWPYQHVTE